MIRTIDRHKEYEFISQTTYYIRNKNKDMKEGIFSHKIDASIAWELLKRTRRPKPYAMLEM